MTALDIQGLTIGYRGSHGIVTVVHEIDLHLAPGRALGLVGESGSGKSTVASAVVGMLPDAGRVMGGRIRFEGRDLLSCKPEEWRALRGRRIATVPQDAAASLNPVLRIGAQMEEVMQGPAQERRQRTLRLLEEVHVPHPEARRAAYPHMLSGGLKQRVLGAMALACEASVVIADEPTTALDVTVQAAYLKLLQELRKNHGFALLMISHDLGVVRAMCDDVAVMQAGRIVEHGPVAEVFDRPRHEYTRRLLRSRPSVDVRRAWLGDGSDAPASSAQGAACVASAGPLLEARDLHRRFVLREGSRRRELLAVDGVNLKLAPGQTLSIVGESGSGKTTTANLLLGLDQPTSGSILWRGKDMSGFDRREMAAFRLETNAVFQDPMASLDPRMTVGASIAEPLRQLRTLDRAAREERVREALVSVQLLPEHASRYPHAFSGGQRQRVAIARALVTRPALIVLDEPVASLDLSVQAQVMNLLKRLQQELGIAYLMISHNLATVRFLSTTVAVLFQGRVVEQGATEDVMRRPRHPYTRRLIAAARAAEGGSLEAVELDEA